MPMIYLRPTKSESIGVGARRQQFLTLLLRENSHIIQHTHLKYIIKWVLVHLQGCAIITTIKFYKSSVTPKRYFIPISSHSLFPVTLHPNPPASDNHSFYLLFLCICLLQRFHLEGILSGACESGFFQASGFFKCPWMTLMKPGMGSQGRFI